MTGKLERNDPCWCGSGKKLKRCHGTTVTDSAKETLSVTPQSTPEPVTTHLVQRNGELVEEPGALWVRLVGHHPDSVDPGLARMRAMWGAKQQDASKVATDQSRLTARLNDVQHKLQGVRYHRENYDRHEDELIERFQSEHKPPAGAEVVFQEPKLIFEIEAFLYQVKSSLDMVAQILKAAGYQSMGESFGDHGERVIKALAKAPKQCAIEAASIEALIASAQSSWLDEAIVMRDSISHQGMLEGLTCFVQRPYMGGGRAELHYPEMPNGQRARHYLERVERELRAFSDQFVNLALESYEKINT